MTVETEAGYTWTDGKFARILHAGNRFKPKSIVASVEAGGTGAAGASKLTYEKWKPFTNAVSDPADLSTTNWTATRFVVGSDGQTLDEGTDAATNRYMQQAITYTAVEWVASVQVERQSLEGIRVNADDGTTTHVADFDLHNEIVEATANCTADLIDLGGGIFECRIYFTPAAASGNLYLVGYNGTTTVYTGDNSTIKILRVAAHASEATLRYEYFSAQSGTCIGIAAHNLWTAGGRITFQHDSNSDSTWTDLGNLSPTDNSPIMFFFDAVSSPFFGIKIDRAVLPEIGVFWVGDPLKMARPFYGNFSPSRMVRNSRVIGNISEGGEFIGRYHIRSALKVSYEWSNLPYAWVRSNLDTPSGLIQSLETEPFFLAWRPSETEDVEFAWTKGPINPPVISGPRDLMSFNFDAEVYSYE